MRTGAGLAGESIDPGSPTDVVLTCVVAGFGPVALFFAIRPQIPYA